jgi:hypothetical protein
MRLVETKGPGWITIGRVYDPGEKYTCAIGWRRGQSRPTKETVERLYPDCKFVGVRHYTGWCPNTFGRKTFTHVTVERIAR